MVAAMVIMPMLVTSLSLALAVPAAAELSYTMPQAWKSRPASSNMRVAEFAVPRAAGDGEDSELVLYYFGSFSIGGVDANINRWIGQMQQPDGSDSKARARRDSKTVNGLKVTSVDLTGTYVAEVRPGASERFNKPGFRLRAAVVETPRGPYFIKMVGPARTMDAAQKDFDAFVASLRYTP
jgi:hypothetical protein